MACDKSTLKIASELCLLQQPEDRKLLKEIGKNGEGRPVEIRQLIEEVFV